MNNTSTIEFEYPSEKYKESFLASLGDDADKYRLIFPAEQIRSNFKYYVKCLNDYRLCINLPDNWVPQTTFWVIKDGKYVGQVVIRHRVDDPYFYGHVGIYLTPETRVKGYALNLGRKALYSCKKMYNDGILKLYENGILVTCDSTNPYTPRFAKAFGFKFLKELPCPQMGKGVKFKYFLLFL